MSRPLLVSSCLGRRFDTASRILYRDVTRSERSVRNPSRLSGTTGATAVGLGRAALGTTAALPTPTASESKAICSIRATEAEAAAAAAAAARTGRTATTRSKTAACTTAGVAALTTARRRRAGVSARAHATLTDADATVVSGAVDDDAWRDEASWVRPGSETDRAVRRACAQFGTGAVHGTANRFVALLGELNALSHESADAAARAVDAGDPVAIAASRAAAAEVAADENDDDEDAAHAAASAAAAAAAAAAAIPGGGDSGGGFVTVEDEIAARAQTVSAQLFRSIVEHPTWLVAGRQVEGSGVELTMAPGETDEDETVLAYSHPRAYFQFAKRLPDSFAKLRKVVAMSGVEFVDAFPTLYDNESLQAIMIDIGTDSQFLILREQMAELVYLRRAMQVEQVMRLHGAGKTMMLRADIEMIANFSFIVLGGTQGMLFSETVGGRPTVLAFTCMDHAVEFVNASRFGDQAQPRKMPGHLLARYLRQNRNLSGGVAFNYGLPGTSADVAAHARFPDGSSALCIADLGSPLFGAC